MWDVPLDWYDLILDARKALEDNKHLLEKAENVHSIEMDPGDVDGENPHLVVGLDENKKAEINSRDLQLQSDDIRVVFEEEPKPDTIEDSISAQSSIIDPDPCGDLWTSGPIPGGLGVVIGDALGTLTPSVYSLQDRKSGWITNSHVASYATEKCGSDLIGIDAEHGGEKIGEVILVDHDRDFVVIEATESRPPSGQVVLPSDHDTAYDINGTMSKDGFDTFAGEGWDVKKVGTTSCETSGTPHRRGARVTSKVNDYCMTPGIPYTDQCSWGSAINDIRPGDSGSLTFGARPDSINHLAMCVNISFTFANRVHGTPGWVINRLSGYEWPVPIA
ncbi:hypothetical protein [Natrarchaeobius oligotrophus]|uniref:hypothetical protein n=1 Tax=Natrarchaeobius oligotrophus TaxID=3455743 RepID=UPI000F51EDF8|nr:hypothetical protein [Natrarchaeobius chitinivorans]